jgi:hypothetical protein
VTIPLTYVGPAYSSCTSSINIPGSCTMLPSGTGVPNSDLVRWRWRWRWQTPCCVGATNSPPPPTHTHIPFIVALLPEGPVPLFL